MKILVVGSNGMLGTDLCKRLNQSSHEVIASDLPDLDITNEKISHDLICQINPQCIINCAAFTAVDDCEKERETAFQVNGNGPGNLARAAESTGARLVHISTDYVFNGEKKGEYLESDPLDPQSVYGESKLEGEKQVLTEIPGNHLIIRTSWLFGVNGNNFVDTILRLAGAGKSLQIVNDQKGCPTYTADLAEAIDELIKVDARGIVNVSNTGATTWYSFASYFLSKTYPHISIKAVGSELFPRPAKRPGNSVLSNTKLKSILGQSLPHWQNAVDRYLKIKFPDLYKE